MTGSPIPGIDLTRPHSARRYDYWLGGKDNFAADRASADRIEQDNPGDFKESVHHPQA